jgi:hypothetical protein
MGASAVGFNMGDVEDALAEIDAGAEETRTAARPVDFAVVPCLAIDRAIDTLDLAKMHGDLIRNDALERWALKAIFRIRRSLDAGT